MKSKKDGMSNILFLHWHKVYGALSSIVAEICRNLEPIPLRWEVKIGKEDSPLSSKYYVIFPRNVFKKLPEFENELFELLVFDDDTLRKIKCEKLESFQHDLFSNTFFASYSHRFCPSMDLVKRIFGNNFESSSTHRLKEKMHT